MGRRLGPATGGGADTDRGGPDIRAAVEVTRDAPERRHVVVRGDRLIGLARRYDVGVTTLAEANQLTPPYVIYVGQTLRVPKASQSRARRTETIASRPDVRYEVRRGDTLSSIARRHDVTVAQLASLNDIRPPYRVLVGQTLTVDR